MSSAARSVVVGKRRSAVSATALRLAHSYVSAFIAPTILFFAISGSLQVFGLHEPHGSTKPNAVISAMARLHKDQSLAPEPERGPGTGGPPGDRLPPGAPENFAVPGGANARPPEPPPPTPAALVLKGLVVLEALALVFATLLGIWIGVTHPKRARAFRIVLVAGTLLPVALILL